MKKTFCDRCGAECDGTSIQRFTIFDVNHGIDVCENCYSEFFRWLKNKELAPAYVNAVDMCSDCKYKDYSCGEDPCVNCCYNYMSKFRIIEEEKKDEN